MSEFKLKSGVFSAFDLKIMACVFMLCDHAGYILFPDVMMLRYIGRLSFPLFAYFIAEGCRYTKNKRRRFLSVFILGIVCELTYIVFSGVYYGNILLTFSASILLIYLLDSVKKAYFKSKKLFCLLLISFIFALIATFVYCRFVGLDYGFFGVLAPVFVVAFDNMGEWSAGLYERVNRKMLSLFMFTIPLVMIVFLECINDYQVLSLISVLLLALYNGERGLHSFKYGFYIFYPLHLVALQGIVFLM